MRLIEFTGCGAELAPLLDELAGLVELQDAVVARTVTLGHEDVAVGCHQHVVRLIEVVGRRRAARFAEREEHFAVGAELVHLIAFRRAGARPDRSARRGRGRRGSGARFASASAAARRYRRVVLTVGHPHVPVAVDEDAVRKDQHAGAEALDQFARRVKVQHRIGRRHLSGRAIETAICGAALGDPDRPAVLVDLDRARRTPLASLGQLEIVLDAPIWVRQIVGRRDVVLCRERGAREHNDGGRQFHI